MSAGTVLGGRYELRVRLGAGGAGTVWKGFDTTLRREVAVKLIALDAVPMPEIGPLIERFRREAQAVAALNHPNVVTAYDFGLQDEVAFLVMELIVGASLSDHLRRIQATGAAGFDEPTVVRIARHVCAGLAVAHRARLVHRDLKPSNLMLVESTGQVKIVDFGIARAAEQSRLTRTGSYLGTLPYVAPEQMGADPVDGRADLYSLGCVLHELASGRSPYEAQTAMQWMSAHQYQQPAPLRRHVPAASAELEALILRLLAKKPEYRPADADAVTDALAGMVAASRVIGGPEVDTGAHMLARIAAGSTDEPNVARAVPDGAVLVTPKPVSGPPVSSPPVSPAPVVGSATESGYFAPPYDLVVGDAPVDRGAVTGGGSQPETSVVGQLPGAPVSPMRGLAGAVAPGVASWAGPTTPAEALSSMPGTAPVSPGVLGSVPVSPGVLGSVPGTAAVPPGVRAPISPVPLPQRPPGPPPRSGPPVQAGPVARSGTPVRSGPPGGRVIEARPVDSGQHPAGGSGHGRRTGLWVVLVVLVLVAGTVAGVVALWHPGRHKTTQTASTSTSPLVPAVGDCYVSGWASPTDADGTTVWAASDRAVPVSCAGPHSFEVVGVNNVDRSAAATQPPAATSPLVRQIYRACDTEIDAYLGGDWRGAYVWLGVALPDPAAWGGGAHWRACVAVSTSNWQGTLATSTTSVHNGLRGNRTAALTCFTAPAGTADLCTAAHTDEVVGVYRANASPWPGAKAVSSLAHDACGTLVAQYLGLDSLSQWHNRKLGWSWWPPDQEQWELGNRSTVCTAHAYTASGTMTGSVRGIGNSDPSP